MKKIQHFMIAALLLLMTNLSSLAAQDFTKTDAGINKILVDTNYVRAMVVTLKPNQKSDVHTHPAHFFYALSDGSLRVFYTDGKTEDYPLKTGDNGFSMPERPHTVQNTGKKEVRFLLVELKEHPYMENKMK